MQNGKWKMYRLASFCRYHVSFYSSCTYSASVYLDCIVWNTKSHFSLAQEKNHVRPYQFPEPFQLPPKQPHVFLDANFETWLKRAIEKWGIRGVAWALSKMINFSTWTWVRRVKGEIGHPKWVYTLPIKSYSFVSTAVRSHGLYAHPGNSRSPYPRESK